MQRHNTPSDIEKTSMTIIEKELAEEGICLPFENAPVIKRVIHCTADFDYAKSMFFTPGAVEKGCRVLRCGADLVTDTNMTRSGISGSTLGVLGGSVYCYMADPRIMQLAKENDTTRAAMSMREASVLHPEAVYSVGNAPTALYEIDRLIREEQFRPGLVIAVPVGFVNVVEAKERIKETCLEYEIPLIAAMGRKGGSNVAAAICNGLIYLATDRLDPKQRGWN